MRRHDLGAASLAVWWTTMAAIGLGVAATGAAAAPPACSNTGRFDVWLEGFMKEAVTAGVTQATIQAALGGMTLDPAVIQIDRGQGFFSQSFLDFSTRLVSPNRLQSGPRQIQRHRAVFDRAEKQYGVPAAVITAFWALESDFGSGMGKRSVLRSLATLAYDCRRAERFRGELLAALKIIDRGDLRPGDMIGSWAGELGQTQFLPTHYLNHAVDYDGDGHRDLMKSAPDIIGSSAAFLASLGWKRGEPWLQEVRVPASMPWQEADLAIRHPRSKWAHLGLRQADGSALPNDPMPASLLLLMGRNGPAFLAYDNFRVFLEWNQSLNYATTAAYLATRYSGASAMSRGNGPVAVLNTQQIKELQSLLARAGYQIGEIDGKLGAATRGAIKASQTKFGLPADSYPSVELIERLKRGR